MAELTRNDWNNAVVAAREAIGQSLAQAKERVGSYLESRGQTIASHGQALQAQALRSAGVSGAAFGVGMMRGRYGGERMKLLGVPLEPVVGLATHALAVGFLTGSGYESYAHAVADGVLASYAAHLGATLGQRQAVQAARSAVPQAAAAGYYVPQGYALPPGYAPAPYALPAVAGYAPAPGYDAAAYAGAAPGAADRAMAEAIAIMQDERLHGG